MRFDKPRHLRQSMSWLHTWSGLVLGWLLFAIFVTGTTSFFRNEITTWMQPEVHAVRKDDQGLARAVALLQQRAPNAAQWTIGLPGDRTSLMSLSWPATGSRPGGEGAPTRGGERVAREGGDGAVRTEGRGGRPAAADEPGVRMQREGRGLQGAERAGEQRQSGREARGGQRTDTVSEDESGLPTGQAQAQGGGGRQNQIRVSMNPATGEVVEPRQTAGGNFLYRFHFELYGLDRTVARWIVGIATFFMFVALVSGVIIHRNIFKDFFTFRVGKGKRSWLDAHNATGVLALPFHIVITFSGLVLLGFQLVPSAVDSAYDGDGAAARSEMRGRNAVQVRPASGERAPLTDIQPLMMLAEKQWSGTGVGSIVVHHPGDAQATIEIRGARAEGLSSRGTTGRMLFDGTTGAPLDVPSIAEPSVTAAIWNTVSALHLGRFASPVPRWLLFASGVLGALMVASGLVMWVVARHKDREVLGHTPVGHRLVEVLNVAAVGGLLCALAAYFWANRLVPVDQADRSLWEVGTFFATWVASLMHALVRRHKAAWVEQLVLAGVLTVSLPLLNAMTGGVWLGGAIGTGQWQVAGFDLCALFIGGLLLYAARSVHRHVPRVKVAKRSGQGVTPAPDTIPAAAFAPASLTVEKA